jgi:hypothetical protein
VLAMADAQASAPDRARRRDLITLGVGLVIGLPLILLFRTVGALIMVSLVWVFYLAIGRRWEKERPVSMQVIQLSQRQRIALVVGTLVVIAIGTALLMVLR